MKRSQRWNTVQICPRRDSNSGSSDLWSNALPTRPRRRAPSSSWWGFWSSHSYGSRDRWSRRSTIQRRWAFKSKRPHLVPANCCCCWHCCQTRLHRLVPVNYLILSLYRKWQLLHRVNTYYTSLPVSPSLLGTIMTLNLINHSFWDSALMLFLCEGQTLNRSCYWNPLPRLHHLHPFKPPLIVRYISTPSVTQ